MLTRTTLRFEQAETNAGGIPGWVVAIEGELRTNATDYFDAWQGYMDFVGEVRSPFILC